MKDPKGTDQKIKPSSKTTHRDKASDPLIAAAKRFRMNIENERALYEEIFDSVVEGIGWVDENEVIRYCNAAYAVIFEEESADALINKSILDYLPPESQKIIVNQTEFRRQNQTSSYEVEIITAKNRHRTVLVSASPRMGENGEYLGSIGALLDITERKRSEELLHLQSDVLERIAIGENKNEILDLLCELIERMVPGSICSVMLLDDTRARLRIEAGPSLSEAAAKGLDGIIPGELAGSCGVAAYLGEKVIVTDTLTDPRWQRFRDLAKKISIRACWSIPILSEGKTVMGTFAISHPEPTNPQPFHYEILDTAASLAGIVIQSRKTETEMRSQLTAMDNATEGIAILNSDGNYLYMNPAHSQIYGYDNADELLGKSWTTLYKDDEVKKITENAMPILMGTKYYRGEHLGKRKDGTNFHQEVSLTLLDDGRQVCLVRDVTDRVEAEKKQRDFDAQVQQAQKLESLGLLAGGVAHDFNNLLVGVLGNAGLALGELPSGLPARENIEDIEKAAERAAELCNQLLAYAGKGKFVSHPLDVSEVVAEMTHLLSVTISKKVLVKYDLPTNLPAIEADPSQIRQVVMNLITNASDAIGDNIGVIKVRTGAVEITPDNMHAGYQVGDLKPGSYVYIRVTDTGRGIEESDLPRIFDPFYTTRITGRGLGLAAASGIARIHDGAIVVQNGKGEAGNETFFTAYFPGSDRPAQSIAHAPLTRTDWQSSGSILVIDDEEPVRKVAKRILSIIGFDVLAASDGQEGIDILRTHVDEVKAIMLDVTMPNLGGEETLTKIRDISADIPVILLSGYLEEDAVGGFKDRGLAGFVQKPFRPQDLVNTLRQILEN